MKHDGPRLKSSAIPAGRWLCSRVLGTFFLLVTFLFGQAKRKVTMPGKGTKAKLPVSISHSFHRCYAAMRQGDIVLSPELPTLKGYAPGRCAWDNKKSELPYRAPILWTIECLCRDPSVGIHFYFPLICLILSSKPISAGIGSTTLANNCRNSSECA